MVSQKKFSKMVANLTMFPPFCEPSIVSQSLRRLNFFLENNFKIELKIILFVFKRQHNLSPKYLSNLLCPYNPSRSLRSSNINLLTIPCSRLKRRGDRAFSVVGPRLWTSLPVQLRIAPSLSVFKALLKTHLFSLAFNMC